MNAPSPRPWRVQTEPVEGRMPTQHHDDFFWIEAAPEPRDEAGMTVNKDRRVVCDFQLYGDERLDSEAVANAELIVRAVNAL